MGRVDQGASDKSTNYVGFGGSATLDPPYIFVVCLDLLRSYAIIYPLRIAFFSSGAGHPGKLRFLSPLLSKWPKPFSPPRKTLCLVVHYFGHESAFIGCSTQRDNTERDSIVHRVVSQLRILPQTEVVICGINGQALLPVDLDFSGLTDPRLLVYEVLARLAGYIDQYDYFLVIEDDIHVPRQVIDNIILFDRENPVSDCLHPNRLEIVNGRRECVDLKAMPGWTTVRKTYRGHRLQVAVNPHSAFLMLSRPKLEYALGSLDPGFRERILGGYMASAFAYYHQRFELYRPYRDLHFHSITHLDHWMNPSPPDDPAAPDH
jgi:hypothetical protein